MRGHSDSLRWAQEVFGGCKLGDERRTRRLVSYAALQAANPVAPTGQVCKGSKADMKGAYNFLSNEQVDPDAIAQGVFNHTAARVECVRDEGGEVVVVEDTSTVGFTHELAQELGNIGGPEATATRGFMLHAALAFHANGHALLGLVHQQRWIRPEQRPGRNSRKQRPYAEKESMKWQRTSEHLRELLGPTMKHVICVCDREADVFEYLQYKTEHKERFVVRNTYDRRVRGKDAEQRQHLRSELQNAPVLGERLVTIAQRGRVRGPKPKPARKHEQVVASVRCATVTLLVTQPSRYPDRTPTTLNAVWVRESDASAAARKKDPLDWLLLTTEPVDTFAAATRVAEFYELRWQIEEHFKILKTGCGLESRRLQSAAGMERMLVILSAIAVNIQQLAIAANARPEASCETVLSREFWTVLYLMTTKKKRLPNRPPTLDWAMKAIARLGGWADTGRTGRMGWSSLWRGWTTLKTSVAAALLGAQFTDLLKCGE